MKRAIAALMLCLSLACDPSLKDGEVTSRKFHPAHTQITLMPIVSSNGKTTTTTLIPVPMYYPESWSVDIKKFDGKKWKRATWWVNRETYDQVTVGCWFKSTDECLEEQPKQRVE